MLTNVACGTVGITGVFVGTGVAVGTGVSVGRAISVRVAPMLNVACTAVESSASFSSGLWVGLQALRLTVNKMTKLINNKICFVLFIFTPRQSRLF